MRNFTINSGRLFLPLSLITSILVFCAATAFALDIPRLKGRVNDYASMISSRAEAELESKLKGLEQTDSTQIVILTVPSLEGEVMEAFTMRVAEAWKIGQKGMDNGVLLFASKADRKLRIEVGYGLEGPLTDLLAGRIIDHEITPLFKAGRFDEGFIKGVDSIAAAVKGEYKASGKNRRQGNKGKLDGGALLFFVIFFFALISKIKQPVGRGIVGSIFAFIAALFILSTLISIALLLFIAVGFIVGMIIPYSPSTPGRRGGGGYWGGGGGGGFGGGGFSGGGGGFGGGGASGGW